MEDEVPDIIALAKEQDMEVFVESHYIGGGRQPFFTLYSPCIGCRPTDADYAVFDCNMKYHVLLATPSAAERREWIAYCIVLAYLHRTKKISDTFMYYANCGSAALRGDTFHRIAVSVLIPEKRLIGWHPKGRRLVEKSYSKWAQCDKEDAAEFFGVPLEVMEERLNLYEGGGIYLTPSLVKGDRNE